MPQIDIREADVGDGIAFKGGGFIFKFLSGWIGFEDKEWKERDWKPWHLAIVSERLADGLSILEAVEPKTREWSYTYEQLGNCRAYRYLDKPPTPQKVQAFKNKYLGLPYDKGAYVGIIFTESRFFNWLFGRWRLWDKEYMCWELFCAFYRFCGEPMFELSEYPRIDRIMKELEADPEDLGNEDIEGLKR